MKLQENQHLIVSSWLLLLVQHLTNSLNTELIRVKEMVVCDQLHMMDDGRTIVQVSIDVERAYTTESDETLLTRQSRGAAVVGALAGLLLVGPLVGVAAGVGAALTVREDGELGTLVKSYGQAVANAGDRIQQWDSRNLNLREHLGRFENQHHLASKANRTMQKGFNYVARTGRLE